MPICRLISLLLALSLIAGDAAAGAWPREAGRSFVAGALRFGWPQDPDGRSLRDPTQGYHTLYMEYGLTPDWTIGLDLGQSMTGERKMLVWAQYPLRNLQSYPKVTAQLAYGTIAEEAILRPGLSLGWGSEGGWFTIDSMAEIEIDGGATDYKMDITLGRNLSRGRKLILQMQTGAPDGGDPFARFVPSLVFPVTDMLKIEAGMSYGLQGDEAMGIKLGFWAEF
ncbi:hypothetical protein [Pseudoponticoccus marisrubri]|uniref:Transporter n=1 Tax=Pseudoponticoccus marisrubri TaxID=1685382 RepID=A0A0W7WQM9_9RHOB|nr:hypothetical protein [Pseudoponticoccus marisrubri]KUF12792.1 hypothetical protein AVJ23_03530 [Pseudoponticoccus marisrubri]